MLKVFILSNNPRVWKEFPEAMKVEGSLRDVLVKARDYVHQGYKLISHPLAGSVKPNETIYKSIVLDAKREALDFKSLKLIESAIEVKDKLADLKRNWDEKVYEDFQLIDCSLLKATFEHFPPDYQIVKID